MRRALLLIGALMILLAGCTSQEEPLTAGQFYTDGKPYTRWWWFASEIEEQNIAGQLDWLQQNGFGGVEIAFIYPPGRTPEAEKLPWRSAELQERIVFAKQYADSLGLGCDFTFGSLWPFGGTFVPDSDRTMIYGDDAFHQPHRLSWEHPDTGNVVDHLDSAAVLSYSRIMGNFLKPALTGRTSALFCDSWEVETRRIWTDSLAIIFEESMGYDITPFMDSIYDSTRKDFHYDYMKVVSRLVTDNFYKKFTEYAHSMGALTRVQCAGAPADLLEAYGSVDIPESEAMLYEPSFSRIPASAAAMYGKPYVTAEAFTCLYGWPAEHFREEQPADLKLVADALFANGVNKLYWHGKPFNPVDADTNDFYASVHVGPTGSLSEHLKPFNKYLETVSDIMMSGETYSHAAVYLPLEDAWMAQEYPDSLQMKWSWGAYELRYLTVPEEVRGYHPLYVNADLLYDAEFKNGKIYIDGKVFSFLYVDVEWMDADGLSAIIEIAQRGFPIVLKRFPREPGNVESIDYGDKLMKLSEFGNVSNRIEALTSTPPLIEGAEVPDYWCRINEEGVLHIFFANPKTRSLSYPMAYGEAYQEEPVSIPVTINVYGYRIEQTLTFAPYQSLLLQVLPDGSVSNIDISYIPPVPEREEQ